MIKLVLLLVGIVFVSSYIISENGYYEYTVGKKTTITNDKIKEFDMAVKNGENISEWQYFYKEEIDYTNRFSNLMYKFSDNSNCNYRSVYFIKNDIKTNNEFIQKTNRICSKCCT